MAQAPGGVAQPALAATAQGAVGVAPAGASAAAAAAPVGSSGQRTIEDHIEAAEHAAKYNPSMPGANAVSGYLMAKMDYNKPIMASLLGDCPHVLRKFLPYDASWERNVEIIKKWYKPNSSTFTVNLLPAASEIESADLGPLHKVIMAFVRARLGMVDNKTNLFPEKVTSSSVFVACMAFTCLVKIFNGAQGVELIGLLTQYQSFIGGMQTLLLDKYDSDSVVARGMKQVRGKSNDPAGQSAFACLNQCSLTAEKKKKELRTRCFKEALPRVDGIHTTLSQIRKSLLLLFVRVHHNQQLPMDFEYLLNGDSENAVEKPNPIFMKNKDLPIGLSIESLALLQAMKDDGHFHELYNVATQRMVALLDQPNANAVVETALGTASVIQQSRRITYSQLLGEKGLLHKLALAQSSLNAQDRTALMYPMLMAEVEDTPALFLVSVLMRKMTADLFMTQIQLANLTPVVASEAIEAYTLSLAEFATDIRGFATRLIAARDHIASMSRFGFVLNYAGTTLLASLVTGEPGAADLIHDPASSTVTGSSSSSSSASSSAASSFSTSSSASAASSTTTVISPQGISEFLKYWASITKFKTDYNSLRYLNELGKLCEELKQQVDLLFEHIKVLRNSTDVVKSYAMMEQAITDLRKFSNGVILATGHQLTVNDGPLEQFRGLLQQQAALVTTHAAAMRQSNNISLALRGNGPGGPSCTNYSPSASASSSSASAAHCSPTNGELWRQHTPDPYMSSPTGNGMGMGHSGLSAASSSSDAYNNHNHMDGQRMGMALSTPDGSQHAPQMYGYSSTPGNVTPNGHMPSRSMMHPFQRINSTPAGLGGSSFPSPSRGGEGYGGAAPGAGPSPSVSRRQSLQAGQLLGQPPQHPRSTTPDSRSRAVDAEQHAAWNSSPSHHQPEGVVRQHSFPVTGSVSGRSTPTSGSQRPFPVAIVRPLSSRAAAPRQPPVSATGLLDSPNSTLCGAEGHTGSTVFDDALPVMGAQWPAPVTAPPSTRGSPRGSPSRHIVPEGFSSMSLPPAYSSAASSSSAAAASSSQALHASAAATAASLYAARYGLPEGERGEPSYPPTPAIGAGPEGAPGGAPDANGHAQASASSGSSSSKPNASPNGSSRRNSASRDARQFSFARAASVDRDAPRRKKQANILHAARAIW